MDIQKAREIVCESGKKLVHEGLIARTWGNVSVRIDERKMIITPSGRKYDELTPEDMVLVDIYTLKHEGIKPSSELKLHCEIYKTRPHIQSVIHTHQLYASVVASTQNDVEVLDPEHQKILGAKTIKAAPYALPNSKSLTVDTAKAVGSSNAALMSNHGVLCIGTNMDETFKVAHTLEAACKNFIDSKIKSA
ncbi:MAG: class II aldolase/adducin family protein [Chitinophagales bacterium]|nr:class II aldolase/adducin family protein [Chitinophagales bacterium]